MSGLKRSFALVCCSALAVMATGCGLTVEHQSAGVVAATTGSVHGGQQPITGATVRVMAPGLTGYGSASSMLSMAVTDGNGGFSMPAYTCPANQGLVYLTVSGGNSGSGTNNLVGEAAVLGPCTPALQSSFVYVTEATTVAAAYTLAPFASVSGSGTSIGTSATNLTGLNNTFAVTNLIAPNSSGTAVATPSYVGLAVAPIAYPQQTLNTLANILASCINTAGSLASGSACATLLSNTAYNSVVPIDTFQAAINIARQSSANVAALYGLTTANAPFQPALANQPRDLSLQVGYAGTIPFINPSPTAGYGTVAIDSAGDAYTLSQTTLVRVAPGGAVTTIPLLATNGYTPAYMAINKTGNIYVGYPNSMFVQQYSPAGLLVSTITSADLSGQAGMAIDGANNLWVPTNQSLTEFNSSGSEVTGSPIGLGSTGGAIAISPLAVWEHTQTGLARFDLAARTVTNYAQSAFFLSIAIDHSNDVWGDNYYLDQNYSVYSNALEVADTGALISPALGYPGTYAIASPQGITIDGLGNVYTVNSTQHPSGYPVIVNAFSSAGALLPKMIQPIPPSAGGASPMATSSSDHPAFDASGNLWIVGPFGAGGYLTSVIGYGAPVVTPLSVAVATNAVAARP